MNEGNNNNQFPPGESDPSLSGNNETLNTGRPAVASAPGKVLIMVLLAGVFIFIVVHSLFFGSKAPPPKETTVKKEVAPAEPPPPIKTGDNAFLPPFTGNGTLPPPVPPTNIPDVAPPPPPPPGPPAVNATPTDEKLKARIHSPMIPNAVGGAVSRLTSGTEKKKTIPADPNSAFAQTIAESSAESVQATQIKDLDRTLAQGKLIQGVLETAIDSTTPAPIRAIVSHDTYAESGKAILIPKGSRLIGVYNSSIKRGQARVFIIWTRVIRPDGVDVALNSPGIDALGRGGAGGFVDNKYFEAFSTAIFTSSLDVGFAALGDSLFGNQQQTTTTGPGGGTSVTSSPTATAMQQAISNLGSVGQAIVNSTVNLEPTIHIDQGELINVFVNKDVMFPTGGMNNAGFIP